jgi:hypothetical protein
MTLSQAREIALSLPEVTEETHFHRISFRVRGKVIAKQAREDKDPQVTGLRI